MSPSWPRRCGYLVAWSGTVWSWSWSWSWNWQDWVVQTWKKKKLSSINVQDTTCLKLKPLFLLKHILPHRNSLTLCKKNDYKLPYVENPNTESQCPFRFAHHIFIRCRNKCKNSGIKRETPGCDTRQEPGFDSTPMFTAIRISFWKIPWLPFLQCLIDSTG